VNINGEIGRVTFKHLDVSHYTYVVTDFVAFNNAWSRLYIATDGSEQFHLTHCVELESLMTAALQPGGQPASMQYPYMLGLVLVVTMLATSGRSVYELYEALDKQDFDVTHLLENKIMPAYPSVLALRIPGMNQMIQAVPERRAEEEERMRVRLAELDAQAEDDVRAQAAQALADADNAGALQSEEGDDSDAGFGGAALRAGGGEDKDVAEEENEGEEDDDNAEPRLPTPIPFEEEEAAVVALLQEAAPGKGEAAYVPLPPEAANEQPKTLMKRSKADVGDDVGDGSVDARAYGRGAPRARKGVGCIADNIPREMLEGEAAVAAVMGFIEDEDAAAAAAEAEAAAHAAAAVAAAAADRDEAAASAANGGGGVGGDGVPRRYVPRGAARGQCHAYVHRFAQWDPRSESRSR
jgi:hypothetical protein